MIKLIIFDLDGVLVDTKKIHFDALNLALEKYEDIKISHEDHVKIFDGLPTSKKLNILKNKNKITKYNFKNIEIYKQKLTKKLLKENLTENKKLIKIFKYLKNKKYKIGIATNAVSSTLNICLAKLGVSKYVNLKLSNEDIKNSKPNPEIYFRMFIHFGVYPSEVLIFETATNQNVFDFFRSAVNRSSYNLITAFPNDNLFFF